MGIKTRTGLTLLAILAALGINTAAAQKLSMDRKDRAEQSQAEACKFNPLENRVSTGPTLYLPLGSNVLMAGYGAEVLFYPQKKSDTEKKRTVSIGLRLDGNVATSLETLTDNIVEISPKTKDITRTKVETNYWGYSADLKILFHYNPNNSRLKFTAGALAGINRYNGVRTRELTKTDSTGIPLSNYRDVLFPFRESGVYGGILFEIGAKFRRVEPYLYAGYNWGHTSASYGNNPTRFPLFIGVGLNAKFGNVTPHQRKTPKRKTTPVTSPAGVIYKTNSENIIQRKHIINYYLVVKNRKI